MLWLLIYSLALLDHLLLAIFYFMLSGPVCLMMNMLFIFESWNAPVILLRVCAQTLYVNSFSIMVRITSAKSAEEIRIISIDRFLRVIFNENFVQYRKTHNFWRFYIKLLCFFTDHLQITNKFKIEKRENHTFSLQIVFRPRSWLNRESYTFSQRVKIVWLFVRRDT